MAQVLIRNLAPRTVAMLKRRAERNGRSLQAELQTILERAATDHVNGRALAERIRRKLGGRRHSDSTKLIAEDRGK